MRKSFITKITLYSRNLCSKNGTLAINGLKVRLFSIPHTPVVIFHPVARRVVITTGKWEKSEQHFHQLSGRMKNGESGERAWKYATTQIRLIYVGSAYRLLLRVFPFLSLYPFRTPSPPAPFYRPRVMSYESPFKTSRAPALPEIIFHVSWLIQTRSNHHLQKTWRKREKGEKGRRRANHPLSSFYALLFFPFRTPMHPPARLHCRFISHFRFTFYHFVTLLFLPFSSPFGSLFIFILL